MDEVQEQTSLKQMIQSMCPEGPGVIEGIVVSESPLKVTLANDSKMVLTINSLIVPRHLTDYKTTVDISGGSVSGSTSKGGSHEHSEGTHEGHAVGIGNHTHVGGSHAHSLETVSIFGAAMVVHNALKRGETVELLEFNNGKQYYILDRKG